MGISFGGKSVPMNTKESDQGVKSPHLTSLQNIFLFFSFARSVLKDDSIIQSAVGI